MLPFTIVELVLLAITSLQVGGVDARKPFTRIAPTNVVRNEEVEERDARRPFTLPADFELNQHRKPFTAPPVITGRPVIENGIAVDRPVIQEATLTTSVLSQR